MHGTEALLRRSHIFLNILLLPSINFQGLSLSLIQLTLKLMYPWKKKWARRRRRLKSTISIFSFRWFMRRAILFWTSYNVSFNHPLYHFDIPYRGYFTASDRVSQDGSLPQRQYPDESMIILLCIFRSRKKNVENKSPRNQWLLHQLEIGSHIKQSSFGFRRREW